MVVTHARSRRKPSGGLFRNTITKRTHMLGRTPSMTKVGDSHRQRTVSTKGGSSKERLFETRQANLFDGKKYVKAKIESVAENPAN
ncbi:30S ribosomal protein S8e, partial [Candidatus Woesearchaeota archaeon]|nr:30S ribosomal protein S8e [Candidatus Woesearchaeota archaeon]